MSSNFQYGVAISRFSAEREDPFYEHPSHDPIQKDCMVIYSKRTAGVVKRIFRESTYSCVRLELELIEIGSRIKVPMSECELLDFKEVDGASDVPLGSIAEYETVYRHKHKVYRGFVKWRGEILYGSDPPREVLAAEMMDTHCRKGGVVGLDGVLEQSAIRYLHSSILKRFPRLKGMQLVMCSYLKCIYLHKPGFRSEESVGEGSGVETRMGGSQYYGTVKWIGTCVNNGKRLAMVDVMETREQIAVPLSECKRLDFAELRGANDVPVGTIIEYETADYPRTLHRGVVKWFGQMVYGNDAPREIVAVKMDKYHRKGDVVGLKDSQYLYSAFKKRFRYLEEPVLILRSCLSRINHHQPHATAEDLAYYHAPEHPIQMACMVIYCDWIYNDWTVGVVKRIFRESTYSCIRLELEPIEIGCHKEVPMSECKLLDFKELNSTSDVTPGSIAEYETGYRNQTVNRGVVKWFGQMVCGSDPPKEVVAMEMFQMEDRSPKGAIIGLDGSRILHSAFLKRFPHLVEPLLILGSHLSRIYHHLPRVSSTKNVEESSRVETRIDGVLYSGTVKWIGHCELTKEQFAMLEMDKKLPHSTRGDYMRVKVIDSRNSNIFFCPLSECELLETASHEIPAVTSSNLSHKDKAKPAVAEELVYDHPQDHPIQKESIVIYNQQTPAVVKMIFRDTASETPKVFMVALELMYNDEVLPGCTSGVYKELQLVQTARTNIIFCPLDKCEPDRQFLDTIDNGVSAGAGVSNLSRALPAVSQPDHRKHDISEKSFVRFMYLGTYRTGVVKRISDSKMADVEEDETGEQIEVALSTCTKLVFTALDDTDIPLGCIVEYEHLMEVNRGVVRWFGKYQEAQSTPYLVVAVDMDRCHLYEGIVGVPGYPYTNVAFAKQFPDLKGSQLVLFDQLTKIYHHEPHLRNPQNIEEGSRVETRIDGLVVYGTVKWIGTCVKTKQGIAMLDTDNVLSPWRSFHRDDQFVPTAHKNFLFCSLDLCDLDRRFVENSNHQITDQNIPLEHRTVMDPHYPSENVEGACGPWKGIQGDINSCYMDSTLFSMFAFSTSFDSLLKPRCTEAEELVKILREYVVYPLRKYGHVAAESLHQLRKELNSLGKVKGIADHEKDPEEFISLLLNDVFRVDPLISLTTNQTCTTLSLVGDKDETTPVPNVRRLLERFCFREKLNFKKTPKWLILLMPRFGKNYKMYDRIFPDLTIDLSHITEDGQGNCYVCHSKETEFECQTCSDEQRDFRKIVFCKECNEIRHKHPDRQGHTSERICASSPRELSEHTLELSAVLCIETSHYVSFCRTAAGDKAPWVFFDSMAQREDGVNVPEVKLVPQAPFWLSSHGYDRLCQGRDPPPLLSRLFKDIYICIYCATGQDSEV